MYFWTGLDSHSCALVWFSMRYYFFVPTFISKFCLYGRRIMSIVYAVRARSSCRYIVYVFVVGISGVVVEHLLGVTFINIKFNSPLIYYTFNSNVKINIKKFMGSTWHRLAVPVFFFLLLFFTTHHEIERLFNASRWISKFL